ncbi:MAG: Hsp33 family molecular chaperone HslO [Lachnospiraceae bacterium]|nr:Hsp33 family molecular chaperone HslO [Lachnospiraceae bacterium]
MSDYIVSAMAAGEQIRAFACTTREMVEHARSIHNTSPVISAALGRMLSAAAMMGSMMKGEKDLLTLQIKSSGPVGGITVTADSGANVKGYANEPQVMIPAKPNGKLDVSGAIGPGMLRVIKDMGLKEPYVGEVELQTGEIAEDITYYFAASEQIPSSVGLGVLMNRDNTVRQAGGFIIQLMPYATDEVIGVLEKNLKNLKSVTEMLDGGDTPENMLGRVLEGLDVEITGKSPCAYRCNCNRDRLEQVMLSLGRKELDEMIEEGKPVEVGCSFCNTKYVFTPDELKKLMQG